MSPSGKPHSTLPVRGRTEVGVLFRPGGLPATKLDAVWIWVEHGERMNRQAALTQNNASGWLRGRRQFLVTHGKSRGLL